MKPSAVGIVASLEVDRIVEMGKVIGTLEQMVWKREMLAVVVAVMRLNLNFVLWHIQLNQSLYPK